MLNNSNNDKLLAKIIMNDIVSNVYALRLRDIRLEIGLSQVAFAKKLRIKASNVCKYEKQKSNITLATFCKYLSLLNIDLFKHIDLINIRNINALGLFILNRLKHLGLNIEYFYIHSELNNVYIHKILFSKKIKKYSFDTYAKIARVLHLNVSILLKFAALELYTKKYQSLGNIIEYYMFIQGYTLQKLSIESSISSKTIRYILHNKAISLAKIKYLVSFLKIPEPELKKVRF